MDARKFLGLQPTHNRFRWNMAITPLVANWSGSLFGGCGLGAGIEILEEVTGRPVVWSTAQYLAYSEVGQVIDLDIEIGAAGQNITQARVIGRVENREILTVNAALGRRDEPGRGQWLEMPDVPKPLDCPSREYRDPDRVSVNQRLEMRIAIGRNMDDLDERQSINGRSAMWARITDLEQNSAASLAILGDWVPFGLGQAMGAKAGGNSLDNTIRIVDLVPTEWVLLDIRAEAIANGFGHGSVRIWAQDGTLMATASQSVIYRRWKH
jgi:acyl-CoA thioesterase II